MQTKRQKIDNDINELFSASLDWLTSADRDDATQLAAQLATLTPEQCFEFASLEASEGRHAGCSGLWVASTLARIDQPALLNGILTLPDAQFQALNFNAAPLRDDHPDKGISVLLHTVDQESNGCSALLNRILTLPDAQFQALNFNAAPLRDDHPGKGITVLWYAVNLDNELALLNRILTLPDHQFQALSFNLFPDSLDHADPYNQNIIEMFKNLVSLQQYLATPANTLDQPTTLALIESLQNLPTATRTACLLHIFEHHAKDFNRAKQIFKLIPFGTPQYARACNLMQLKYTGEKVRDPSEKAANLEKAIKLSVRHACFTPPVSRTEALEDMHGFLLMCSGSTITDQLKQSITDTIALIEQFIDQKTNDSISKQEVKELSHQVLTELRKINEEQDEPQAAPFPSSLTS